MNHMTETTSAEPRQDNSTRTLILGFVFAALALYGSSFIGHFLERMGADYFIVTGAIRTLLSVAGFIALGGARWLHVDLASIRRVWWYCKPFIIINLIISLIVTAGVIMGIANGTVTAGSILYWGGYATFLCVMVGINEETMFRGLVFGGLLTKLGNKQNGPLMAAIISSLIFGAVHVVGDMDVTNGYSVATAAMKTLETMMFAIVLCAAVLKERNLWGAATTHAFFDWVILAGNVIAAQGMYAPSYVSSDPSTATYAIGLFTVMSLLYLPKTIRALKDLKEIELPQEGPFGQQTQ